MDEPNEIERLYREMARCVGAGSDKRRSVHGELRDNRSIPDLIDELARVTSTTPTEPGEPGRALWETPRQNRSIPDLIDELTWITNLGRILLGILFFVSFIFEPLVKRPLSLLWLRIVESGKPIFTLVLGGVAS